MQFKAEARGRFTFKDPAEGTITEFYAYRDPETGFMFAIDSEWLEQEASMVESPFVDDSTLKLPIPKDDSLELGLTSKRSRSLFEDDDEEEEDEDDEPVGKFGKSDEDDEDDPWNS